MTELNFKNNVPKLLIRKILSKLQPTLFSRPMGLPNLPALPSMAQLIDRDEVKYENIEYDLDIAYEPLVPNSIRQKVLGSTVFINNSSTTDEQTWKLSKKSIDTFSYGFEEGLELGVETTFKAGVPLVGEAEVTINIKGSFKANQQWTSTKEEERSIDTKINIPPYSKVEATLILDEGNYSINYEAKFVIKSVDVVLYKYGVPQKLFALKEMISSISLEDRTYKVKGKLTGNAGLNTRIQKNAKT